MINKIVLTILLILMQETIYIINIIEKMGITSLPRTKALVLADRVRTSMIVVFGSLELIHAKIR